MSGSEDIEGRANLVNGLRGVGQKMGADGHFISGALVIEAADLIDRLTTELRDEHTSNILNLQAATVKLNVAEADLEQAKADTHAEWQKSARLSEQVEKERQSLAAMTFLNGANARRANQAEDYALSLREQVEKQGKVVEAAREIKPKEMDNPYAWGSVAISRQAADNLRAALNGLVVVGERGDGEGLHSAEPNDVRGANISPAGEVRQ